MRFLKNLWAVTWRVSLFVVLWGLLLTPALMLLAPGDGAGDSGLNPRTRLVFELVGVLAVITAAWIMVRFVDRRPFVSLGFKPRGAGTQLLLGLALGTAMISVAVAVLWLAGWAETTPMLGFSWGLLSQMGLALLLNSVTQEVLVQGYFLQTVESRFNAPIAVLAAATFFTALHAGALVEGGVLPGINLFLAGVLLALAYVTRRSLWLPIALHFAWNFLQGPVLGIAVSGQDLGSGWQMLKLEGPAIFTGGSFGLEGGLVATLATGLGVAALAVGGYRRGTRGAEQEADL